MLLHAQVSSDNAATVSYCYMASCAEKGRGQWGLGDGSEWWKNGDVFSRQMVDPGGRTRVKLKNKQQCMSDRRTPPPNFLPFLVYSHIPFFHTCVHIYIRSTSQKVLTLS